MYYDGVVISIDGRHCLHFQLEKKPHVFELLRTHNSDGCFLVPQIFSYEVDWDTSNEQC